MKPIPQSIFKRVEALRKKLTKAIEIAAANKSVTLTDMGLNHANVAHITHGNMVILLPEQKSSGPKYYAASCDLAGLTEKLEVFIEYYTAKAMESYQRDMDRQAGRPIQTPASEKDAIQATPGFRKVFLQDSSRWQPSETHQSKRGASSLGGNSFAYHGD